MLQVASHPSPILVPPSSHSSADTVRLSPHVGVQTLGAVPAGFVHSQPVSILHEASHPSPGASFPSSHCSGAEVMLFPQSIEQTLGTTPAGFVHS